MLLSSQQVVNSWNSANNFNNFELESNLKKKKKRLVLYAVPLVTKLHLKNGLDGQRKHNAYIY